MNGWSSALLAICQRIPKVLKQELDKRGLKVTGSFVEGDLANPDTSWPRIEKQLRGWGQIFNQFNAKFLVLIQDCYTNLFTGEQICPGPPGRGGLCQAG